MKTMVFVFLFVSQLSAFAKQPDPEYMQQKEQKQNSAAVPYHETKPNQDTPVISEKQNDAKPASISKTERSQPENTTDSTADSSVEEKEGGYYSPTSEAGIEDK